VLQIDYPTWCLLIGEEHIWNGKVEDSYDYFQRGADTIKTNFKAKFEYKKQLEELAKKFPAETQKLNDFASKL